MNYIKQIDISSGMVIARVRDEEGSTKGLKFFSPFIASNKAIERMCKKAHLWADERIKICERQEV